MLAAICHHRKAEILLSPSLPFLFLLLPPQTMVAILKVTNSSLLRLELLDFSILHKACLLHAFPTWLRLMLDALEGDWHRMGQVSEHVTRWTPARDPEEGWWGGRNELCTCLHEATYYTSSALVHWRKSRKLHKMMPPVSNLRFLVLVKETDCLPFSFIHSNISCNFSIAVHMLHDSHTLMFRIAFKGMWMFCDIRCTNCFLINGIMWYFKCL